MLPTTSVKSMMAVRSALPLGGIEPGGAEGSSDAGGRVSIGGEIRMRGLLEAAPSPADCAPIAAAITTTIAPTAAGRSHAGRLSRPLAALGTQRSFSGR